jgi:hypothetical protein
MLNILSKAFKLMFILVHIIIIIIVDVDIASAILRGSPLYSKTHTHTLSSTCVVDSLSLIRSDQSFAIDIQVSMDMSNKKRERERSECTYSRNGKIIKIVAV